MRAFRSGVTSSRLSPGLGDGGDHDTRRHDHSTAPLLSAGVTWPSVPTDGLMAESLLRRTSTPANPVGDAPSQRTCRETATPCGSLAISQDLRKNARTTGPPTHRAVIRRSAIPSLEVGTAFLDGLCSARRSCGGTQSSSGSMGPASLIFSARPRYTGGLNPKFASPFSMRHRRADPSTDGGPSAAPLPGGPPGWSA